MAYDLSGNIELKNQTFDTIQKPKAKLFWKDGKPEEEDITRFLKSASGSLEMQNIDREATKNTLDVELENTDNDDTMPGFWFPQNSLSNGETVRIELGYDHSGSGDETISMSRGIVRQLVGKTDDKSSRMSVLDNGKDFDKEITINTFFKNKKPYQIITSICAELGYLEANSVGNKKLIIRTKNGGDIDESFMIVKYYAITEQFGWDVINSICECSLGRFFVNREGDVEYWTYNYSADKFSETNKNADFEASIYKNPGEEIMPVFSHEVDCSYGNMINSTEVNYNIFIKKENFYGDQFNFELASGETETFEIELSSGYYETLDTNYNSSWSKEGFTTEDYQGTTYGVDLEITSVVNNYNKLYVTIKNNNANYLYCYIEPKVLLGYSYKSKTIKKKESDDLFIDGTENFKKNKETKKTISGNIICNSTWADEIGFKYIELYRNPQRTTTIKTTGFPQVDLGDIVKITNLIETKNKIIYGWINKIDWNLSTDEGFLMTFVLYILSSANALSTILLDEFINLDFTSSYNGLDFTGSSFQLSNSPGGYSSDTNGNIIIDRFGGLLNQGIADEKTSSQTNVSTGFNLQGGFKTLGFNSSFTVIV